MAKRKSPVVGTPGPKKLPRQLTPEDSIAAGTAQQFLEKLRPGGPWVLTAIIPDGSTTTITARTAREVEAFVSKHNGKRNLYYSVNPTRRALNKKAAKTDIAAIEYALGDLDPNADETPDAAKERYLEQLDGDLKPTAVIDSGNGIQCLWKLRERIPLGEPVWVEEDGKNVLRFSPEDQVRVADVEARIAAVMVRLGSKAGTQNIDRILRLPNTINLPNAAKREAGRVECPTALIGFNGVSYPLDAFPKGAASTITLETLNLTHAGVKPRDDTRSSRAFEFMGDRRREGMTYQEARKAILDRTDDIGKWAREKGLPKRERELKRAYERSEKPPVQTELVIVKASEVKMKQKEFLWPGHLLRGGLELTTGQPGLGKSQVQCHLMACVTAGLPWPDGAPANEPMNAIMVTAEDALDTEVVPRLQAAGADLDRVHIVKAIRTDQKQQRQFLLAEDLEKLEQMVAKIGNVGLICIDPITAYMGGKVDSHKATEVRSQLGPLKDFAERTNIAVSAITHPAKNASARAIDHFIGSQAFIAAARIGHACFEEMEEDENGEKTPTGRILYTNPKNNPHRKMPTLAFKVESAIVFPEPYLQIETSRVVWDKGTVDVSAEQAISSQQKSGKKAKAGATPVEGFIVDMLCAASKASRDKRYWCKHAEIKEHAEALGYSEKELRMARENLKVQAKRVGGVGKDGWWEWGWDKPPLIIPPKRPVSK